MSKTAALTAARLRDVLDYDPETGVFTWRVKMSSRAMPGQVAGTLSRYGYIQIKLDGVIHRANRLAWLHVTGEHPSMEVDHRNRVRSENHWDNLRDVSALVNRQNMGPESAGRGELLGTTLHKQSGLIQAQIKVNGKHKSLGYFLERGPAHAAYLEAKRALHEGCTI